tara:strand:- start:517 stop:1431 length:915 start_codon:yes stop_codon:yes gene_type:complete
MIARVFSFLLLSLTILGCGNDNVLTYEKIEEVEVYPDVWVDSFIQPVATEGYDILWVIDRSGSMNSHDANLLLGIETMMTALPIDTGWRLGIISADSDEAIGNQTFPLVPGDDIDDATDSLNALSSSSYGGYLAGEEGFEAVYSYVTLNPYSSTWMRPSAALLVVFVSDEEEQSLNWNVPEFASYLRMTRSLTFVTSIVGLEGGGGCGDQEGLRYIDLAREFSGIEIDICSSDWSQGVEEASKEFEPIDHIELTEIPEDGSIVVFLDGVPTANSDWEYEPATNTVHFLVIPADGVLVEVAYFID